jgi:hypothetical protein
MLRAANDDPPGLGPFLQVLPRERARVLGLELIPQGLWVVVVAQLEALAGA